VKIERIIPADILKPFIRTFIIIESENGTVNEILPDTSIVMAFRLKGFTSSGKTIRHPIPASAVSGLTNSSRIIDYAKQSATLLVVFTEGGASAFFNHPLHELFSAHISLDNFIPCDETNEIENRLAEALNNNERIYIIERFLLSNLKKPAIDPLMHHAIGRIKASNGSIKIKELAASLNIQTIF
jgi:hypothetical protein